MCGVAAAYSHAVGATGVDREELRAVRDHMAARGPDGAGEWFSEDGRVGLAHRRLAIIETSELGAQPMASADGKLVISFNGEIYNYRELKKRLESRGRVFRTGSDTEVILQLYEEHGTGMLPMLRGMFAFALWDGRKGEMLLARDPFGIKPLYYSDDGRTLRAASQVKALLKAATDTQADPAGHAGFLLWGSVPEPWTLYRGIRCIQAGHFMWVGAKGVCEPQAYWRVRDELAQALAEPAHLSRESAVQAVAAAVHDSIRAHLVADVPVGLFLSAGVDSAMIASAMVQAGASPHAVTLGFSEYAGRPEDERARAVELARALGLRHSAPTIARKDFDSDRGALLRAMDQPSIDGVNTWFVARAAAREGMKVALSGIGGDELLGSYPSFRQVPRLRDSVRWAARVPGLGYAFRRLSAPLIRRRTSPKYAGLLEYGGTTGGAYLLRRGLFMPWELPEVMDPDMARAGWQALQQLARLEAAADMPAARAADRMRISALEMSWYMRNQLLRDADWAGMAHSLEIRVPFVDTQLLRAVAPAFAAQPQVQKAEVARAVAPGLPPQWFARPKTGFLIPVRQWMTLPGPPGRGYRPWARLVLDHARSAAGTRPRVLVSTIEPGPGGVQAMTDFVVDALVRRGLEPVIAHYAPYRVMPALSVPSFRLLQRRVGWKSGTAADGSELHAIGAWLPEFEFTHYAATQRWRGLIQGCQAHVAVSGNILAATPYWQSGRPYLAWVATDWEGDRRDRVKTFHPLRRCLDLAVNGPVIRWLERRLLRAGHVLPLSEYTARSLSFLAGRSRTGPVLPMGIDTDFFAPRPDCRIAGRIGFAGRFADPRKNIGLLLEAVAQLLHKHANLTCVIVGDVAGPALVKKAAGLGISGRVEFKLPQAKEELIHELRSLDVFIIPSRQEGLCIAALEAMACGVPVVSTRCGGPEEFVIDGATGFVVEHDPNAMVARVDALLSDPALRNRLGNAARRLVEDRYSLNATRQIFWNSFTTTFPALAAAAEGS